MKNLAEGYNRFRDDILNSTIFHIPHSRTLIPDYSGMNISLIDNEIKLLTDHYTEDIFYTEDIEQLIFPYNRIFCDVERLLDIDEPMFKKGKGFFYTHTDDGLLFRTNNIKEKVQEVYFKHHLKLAQMTQDRLNNIGICTIVDCHSFPNQILISDNYKIPKPDICIGTDDYHTPEFLIKMFIHHCELNGYTYKINTPYSGTIIPTQYKNKNPNVIGVMIEINRNLYMKDNIVDFYQINLLNKFIGDIF